MATAKSVNEKLVRKLRRMLKDVPVEVLGHIDAQAVCCGNGTVALVRIEEGLPAARKKRAAPRRAPK
jgi:hypothetical protein